LILNKHLIQAQKYIDNLENNFWADSSFSLDLKNPADKINPTVLENFTPLKATNTHAYNKISAIFDILFADINLPKLFKNLCILRVIAPSSKREAVNLLEEMFNLQYSLNQIYYLKDSLPNLKAKIVNSIMSYAVGTLGVDFKLIFYDVTTLYFESFTEDDLKKCGFSKDNKFNQPQIVIGLLVDKSGFPLSYEIYEGNKFEGHTFIPTIKNYITQFGIQNLTVVADAAMMSRMNFEDLDKANLKYIIGARVSNLSLNLISEISQTLNSIPDNTYRIDYGGHCLVTHYSAIRALKDRSDRLKQKLKAENMLEQKKPVAKTFKFIKKISKDTYEFNQALLDKAEKLEGIKGYHTNLDLPSIEIVRMYANLWKIEQNFRVVKTDLEIRPIFHWKEKGIKFHILLNYVALAISRLIEQRESMSIKAYVKKIMKKKEFYVLKLDTNEVFVIR
jgi:transposase